MVVSYNASKKTSSLFSYEKKPEKKEDETEVD